MDSLLDLLESYFDAEAIPRDSTGSLAGIGKMLERCRPSLLFLATARGKVKAAESLAPAVDFGGRRTLADELCPGPSGAEHDVRERTWDGRSYHAFAAGLNGGAEPGVLGGLCEYTPEAKRELEGLWPALALCGEIAWGAVRSEVNARTLRDQIAQLVQSKPPSKGPIRRPSAGPSRSTRSGSWRSTTGSSWRRLASPRRPPTAPRASSWPT